MGFGRLLLSGAVLLASAAGFCDDFTSLREQYVEITRPAGPPSAAAVKAALDARREDGSFSTVDYGNSDRNSWRAAVHWNYLATLARSYRFGENDPAMKARLLEALTRGIDHWSEKGYTNPNWWHQSIGVPRSALPVLLQMGDALPAETLEKFRPILDRSKPGMTGQNRTALASIHFLKGILYRDAQMVADGRKWMLEGFAVAGPGEEGLQPDYSFHQHGPQLQFGNYGLEFFDTATMWAAVLQGTSYACAPEQIELVFNYFMNGQRWVQFRDVMDFSACARQIIDKAQTGKFGVIKRSALLFRRAASPEQAAAIDEFYRDPAALEGARYFPYSDYLVFRRNGLFFSVRMSSSRVIGSEATNEENLRGVHTGAGSVQLLRSAREYLRIMPLWNWRRLPGVTAVQDNSSLKPRRINKSSLVGGIDDGRNGGAMMELESPDLRARKSYLCFDGYVAVFAGGISSGSAAPVNSTVDSLWFAGKADVVTGDGVIAVTDGTAGVKRAERVRHNGVEYVFPTPVEVFVERRSGKGDWRVIQPSTRAEAVEGEVFTLWVDHGVKPAGANLEYLMVTTPGAEKNFRLLASGDKVQGGYDAAAKLVLISFFEPGKVEIPGVGTLEAMQPAMVLIRDGNLSAADPLRKGGKLLFKLDGKSIER